jgi:hypothetical protein
MEILFVGIRYYKKALEEDSFDGPLLEWFKNGCIFNQCTCFYEHYIYNILRIFPLEKTKQLNDCTYYISCKNTINNNLY